MQRADSGVWLYPTGWADIGYSPAEVAVKEVLEETGVHCVPERLIAVLDGLRLGFTRIPLYSLVFHCRAVGGDLEAHPLECADVGWFDEDHLPSPMAGLERWAPPPSPPSGATRWRWRSTRPVTRCGGGRPEGAHWCPWPALSQGVAGLQLARKVLAGSADGSGPSTSPNGAAPVSGPEEGRDRDA